MGDCIPTLGRFVENDRGSPKLGYFSVSKSYAIHFSKQNGLGNILGDFATNASGRPVDVDDDVLLLTFTNPCAKLGPLA
jgi:hypothetical protein